MEQKRKIPLYTIMDGIWNKIWKKKISILKIGFWIIIQT